MGVLDAENAFSVPGPYESHFLVVLDDILVVDPLTELYIIGSTIDYVEEVFGSYLKISNPMATSSCGCGESFGV